MAKAAIFDIDGTLAPHTSWTTLTKDLGADPEEHERIFRKYREGKLAYDEARRRLIDLWKATGNATRPSFEAIFRAWPLRDGAESLFDYLHDGHYLTCLITGSMDLYAAAVAQRLGADRYYANTELVWDGNGVLADMHYEADQGAKKVRQLAEFCEAYGLKEADCVAVGDGENDIPIFLKTGMGIALRGESSPRLEAVAWRSVENLAAIKGLL